MNIKRLPIVFLLVGLVFKALLVFLWRIWQLPGLPSLLIYYDPGARYFTEGITQFFFNRRGFPGRVRLLRDIPGHRLRYRVPRPRLCRSVGVASLQRLTKHSVHAYDAVAYMCDCSSKRVLFADEGTGELGGNWGRGNWGTGDGELGTDGTFPGFVSCERWVTPLLRLPMSAPAILKQTTHLQDNRTFLIFFLQA